MNQFDENQKLQRERFEQELVLAKETSKVPPNPYAPAMFSNQNKQNLVELELDFKPELEAIERLLRCDVIKRDENGNEYWAANEDHTKVFFNELGVQDFIRNLIIIVNKHKVLANYTIDEINDRVKQIKHEIRMLIYNNYEQYGLDNEYKMNNYSMIVLSVGSVIEDAYRRALNGETHKGLSEQRLVTQTESTSQPQQQSPVNIYMQQQKKGIISKLMPWNWGK